jgi:hypothetical protein
MCTEVHPTCSTILPMNLAVVLATLYVPRQPAVKVRDEACMLKLLVLYSIFYLFSSLKVVKF